MLEFLSFSLTDNIAIIIIIIMCFFALFLLSKNKKLKDEIEDLKLGDRILADKYKRVDKENVISIDKISTDNVLTKNGDIKNVSALKVQNKSLESSLDSNDKINDISIDKDSDKIDEVAKDRSVEQVEKINKFDNRNEKDKVKEVKGVDGNKHSKPYSKNILHDSPSITSPISLDVEKVSFNADEFVKRDNIKNSSKISTSDYLENISNAISEEIKPQTIELTGYEKEQEESAIISYKELLKASKSGNGVNVSQEDTSEFIEELKKLRNSL